MEHTDGAVPAACFELATYLREDFTITEITEQPNHPSLVIFALVSPFHVYLLCLGTCLA